MSFLNVSILQKHWRWREPGAKRAQFSYRSNEFLQNLASHTSLTLRPEHTKISHSRMPRSNSFSDLSETMKQKMASIANNDHFTKENSSPLGSTRVLETSRKLLATLNQGGFNQNFNHNSANFSTYRNNSYRNATSLNRGGFEGNNLNKPGSVYQTLPRKRNVSLEKSLKIVMKLLNSRNTEASQKNQKSLKNRSKFF